MFTASELFTSTIQTAVLLKQPVRALTHAKTQHNEVLRLSTAIQLPTRPVCACVKQPQPLMTTALSVTSRSRKHSPTGVAFRRTGSSRTLLRAPQISQALTSKQGGGISLNGQLWNYQLLEATAHAICDRARLQSGWETKRRHLTRHTRLTLSKQFTVVYLSCLGFRMNGVN